MSALSHRSSEIEVAKFDNSAKNDENGMQAVFVTSHMRLQFQVLAHSGSSSSLTLNMPSLKEVNHMPTVPPPACTFMSETLDLCWQQ